MTIVVIIVAVVLVAAVAAFLLRGRGTGGRGLQRRFGPEYARAVTDHDGDTKAAEQELGKRVKEHGSLTQQALTPAARERYRTRWAAIQEQFVESPQQAVTDGSRADGVPGKGPWLPRR